MVKSALWKWIEHIPHGKAVLSWKHAGSITSILAVSMVTKIASCSIRRISMQHLSGQELVNTLLESFIESNSEEFISTESLQELKDFIEEILLSRT